MIDVKRWRDRWWVQICTLVGLFVGVGVVCAVNTILDAFATWEALVFGLFTAAGLVGGQLTKESSG